MISASNECKNSNEVFINTKSGLGLIPHLNLDEPHFECLVTQMASGYCSGQCRLKYCFISVKTELRVMCEFGETLLGLWEG